MKNNHTANHIPIYLISLTKDSERRELLANRFPLFSSQFILINSVDGRELSARDYYLQILPYFKTHQRILTPSELGTTLSHVKALTTFLESNAEFALIIEDDIIGNDEDIHHLLSLAQQLDKQTLLSGGGLQGVNARYLLGKKTQLQDTYNTANLANPPITRACAYIVSRFVAQSILHHHQHNLTIADDWGIILNGTKIKIYYTDILQHPTDLSTSNIESERQVQEPTLIGKLLGPAGFKQACLKLYREIALPFYKLAGYQKLPIKSNSTDDEVQQ